MYNITIYSYTPRMFFTAYDGVTTRLWLGVKPNLVTCQTSVGHWRSLLKKLNQLAACDGDKIASWNSVDSIFGSILLIVILSPIFVLSSYFCGSCLSLSRRRHIEAFVGLIGWSGGQPTLARPRSAFGWNQSSKSGPLKMPCLCFKPISSRCFPSDVIKFLQQAFEDVLLLVLRPIQIISRLRRENLDATLLRKTRRSWWWKWKSRVGLIPFTGLGSLEGNLLLTLVN